MMLCRSVRRRRYRAQLHQWTVWPAKPQQILAPLAGAGNAWGAPAGQHLFNRLAPL